MHAPVSQPELQKPEVASRSLGYHRLQSQCGLLINYSVCQEKVIICEINGLSIGVMEVRNGFSVTKLLTFKISGLAEIFYKHVLCFYLNRVRESKKSFTLYRKEWCHNNSNIKK